MPLTARPCRRPLPWAGEMEPFSESLFSKGARMNTAYFLINTVFDLYLMGCCCGSGCSGRGPTSTTP